jgi:nucleotide-binding universal stress UspA family protein
MDYKIREGVVYKEITNQAKYDDAYLIVMGTHGISGFEEYFIGSNAYKVVSNAPCPVITVRNGYTKKSLNKIILPIDVSRESRQKVPVVAELATMFDAEIHTVAVRETNAKNIVDKLEAYSEQVCDYFANKKVKCHTESIFGENITEMTIEYAKGVDADLIAIMTEQSENPKNLLLGAYAQQMVNHSPIPVLSVRPM